eukprot:PITA_35821
MLTTDIIEPVEESDWVSPMVVQGKKKKDEIRICVDLMKLNDACVHDPFLTPFTNEVLDNIGGQEAFSFTDGFSGYRQIKITLEDRSKKTFTTEWGCFQYTIILFGLKNVLAILLRVVVAMFKEFIHKFLEIATNGRPYEDNGDTKLGSIEECEATVCYPGTYRILQKVYQRLCLDHHAYGETVEEGCHILLEQ